VAYIRAVDLRVFPPTGGRRLTSGLQYRRVAEWPFSLFFSCNVNVLSLPNEAIIAELLVFLFAQAFPV